MATTVLRTAGGVLDTQDEEEFDALVARISTGAPKILLYVHGGLVTQDAAEQKAIQLSGSGDRAFNAPDEWEQVYIAWRTGFLETLRENWSDLAKNDRLYDALLKRLLSFVSGKLKKRSSNGARSPAFEGPLRISEIERRLSSGSDDPFGDLEVQTSNFRLAIDGEDESELESELRFELEADTAVTGAAEDIGAAVASRVPTSGSAREAVGNSLEGVAGLSRLDAAIQRELQEGIIAPGATRSYAAAKVTVALIRYGVEIGLAVLRRFRDGRDHGLHATIVEEIARTLYGDRIGSAVWGAMVSDASEHFQAEGLGKRLISAIAGNPEARLVFVGHSAGSILATELLSWAARNVPNLRMDLVLLAPAVRIGKFSAMLKEARPCVRSFRMFILSDELERKDAVLGRGWGFVYPSSLLYAVSGLFEVDDNDAMPNAPLLGMQRFLEDSTSWLDHQREGASIRAAKAFLDGGPDQVVVSKSTGRPGLECAAISHGGFDEDVDTLRSIKTLLA